MAPRVSLLVPRSCVYRTRAVIPQKRLAPLVQPRFVTDDANAPKGPNQDQSPHVSEEQAATDKIMGETPPDLSQGTPVQEILQRDEEAQEKAPQVLKDEMQDSKNGPNQKRSFSTSARRPAAEAELVQFEGSMAEGLQYPDAGFGHKFQLADAASIPRSDHLKRRYDEVVTQVTNSIMRHGKLSQAQSNMSKILDTLRTAPPPQANVASPGRALLGSTPRTALPLSPVEYLTTAIDSVAPLLKIRQQKGVAGGGASLPIPVPMGIRQRRRTAIQWILASADNRREVDLADRVAKEIINIAEGKSGVWEKRALVHKLAISARSNVRYLLMRRR